MRRFAEVILFLVCILPNRIHAEELVCRYCQGTTKNALPKGMKLDGKYHYAPDRQVDVQHIKIDVTPNFETRTLLVRHRSP